VTDPPRTVSRRGGELRAVEPRVISVDVLRGLTVAAMVLVNNPGSWSAIYWPLRHAEWNGFTPTDMIFPFFLFIVGVAIPLALGARLERDAPGLVGRVLRRSLAIFALGLLLHALPWFHLATLRVPGVLQRIAVCYLLAALLVIWSRGIAGWRLQALAAGALLVGYWLLMTRVPVPGGVAGDLSPAGNLAGYVDRLVLGPHVWTVSKFYDPEGLLSSLPAVATTLLGVLAGHWLRGAGTARRVTGGLVLGGLAATAVGWLWGQSFPINKSLWTSSYALFMAGLAALALAACYWLIEGRRWRRLAGPFVVLGITALPLFFLSSLMARLLLLIRVGPEQVRLQAWLFDRLFASWLPPIDASLAYALAYVLLWWGLMWALSRTGVRLRV
jgi:predicted acyltransferase